MKSGKASWTAEMTAVFRAAESIKPPNKRLLHDVHAAKFLRPVFRTILSSRFLTKFIIWAAIDRRFPGASTTVVSRVRFVDDCLKDCIKTGIDQLVILGAGYDSRAYRFEELRNKRVFEVDHPATQSQKKRKITNIFGHLPEHVVYVPVDFEKDRLMPKLFEAGYNKNHKTLFIWEGVCKYLTKNAVNDLLSSVSGNACQGSSIVFEYLYQSMLDGSSGLKLSQKILQFQLKKGEPFIFGLPEKNPEKTVISQGFSSVKNISAEKLKDMYFTGKSEGKRLQPFWGVIHATV